MLTSDTDPQDFLEEEDPSHLDADEVFASSTSL